MTTNKAPPPSEVTVSPAARRFAAGVLMLTIIPAGYITLDNQQFVWNWMEGYTPEPDVFTDRAMPGFLATVAWIREAGMSRIHSLPYDSNPYIYQRLIEMLYPVLLVETLESDLASGTLVVLKSNVNLVKPSDFVVRHGALKIVKVR